MLTSLSRAKPLRWGTARHRDYLRRRSREAVCNLLQRQTVFIEFASLKKSKVGSALGQELSARECLILSRQNYDRSMIVGNVTERLLKAQRVDQKIPVAAVRVAALR